MNPYRKGPKERKPVKTTIDLPEYVWRAAKIRAMDTRTDLRQVVIAALKQYLQIKPKKKSGGRE